MKNAFFSNSVYYNSKIHKNCWLLVNDDAIEGISEDTPGEDYKQTIFNNSAIFPGLINTHTHLPMSIFRGMADDISLMEWLQKHIWPAESKWLSNETVYTGTLLSLAEMLRSGVTAVNDMYFFTDSIANALQKAQMKGVLGLGVLDFPHGNVKNAPQGFLEKAKASVEKFKGNSLVNISLCPHALYTASPDTFKLCVDFVQKNDILLHTHLAENESEVNQIVEKYGKTPALLMNETGAFDCKSIFAHTVKLTDDEIKILGKKNVSISHCIESNLKLASGFAPIKQMLEAGVNVTIGTDGAASNNDQSLISEMSTVSKVHKALNNDATVLPAQSVLDMATENAAKALHLDRTGVLRKGFKADFFVLSLNAANVTPCYNPISHLIYSAGNQDITDVYINGHAVLKNGVITTFDENDVKNKAREIAKLIKGN